MVKTPHARCWSNNAKYDDDDDDDDDDNDNDGWW